MKAHYHRAGLAVLVFLLSTSASALAQRVALVVGAGAYTSAPPLPNPPNDGRAVAAALKRGGYNVAEVIDPSAQGLRDAVSAFTTAAMRSEAAVFYYAGHAIQVAGENYLIPVDGKIGSIADVPKTTVALNPLLEAVARNATTLIVVLDACRNNPFADRLGASTTGTRGLAEVNLSSLAMAHASRKGVGALIAFATAPGEFAQDGDGQHSPYTAGLLKYLSIPGVEIGRLFRMARKEVVVATNGTQRPWEQSSLLDDFYLITALAPQAATAPSPTPVAPPSSPPATSASAATPSPPRDKRLSGREIADLLTDAEFIGRAPGARLPYLAQIRGDGGITVVRGYDPSAQKPESRTIRGTWRVEGDRLCRDFPKGTVVQNGVDRSSSCEELQLTSTGLTFTHPDGVVASQVTVEALRNIKKPY